MGYELKNRQVHPALGHVTQIWVKGQWDQTTYAAKMCYNSVLGGHIKFILGQKHEGGPQMRGT